MKTQNLRPATALQLQVGALVEKHGTQKAAAEALGVGESAISLALSCGMLPKSLVRALGYRRVTHYEPIKGNTNV